MAFVNPQVVLRSLLASLYNLRTVMSYEIKGVLYVTYNMIIYCNKAANKHNYYTLQIGMKLVIIYSYMYVYVCVKLMFTKYARKCCTNSFDCIPNCGRFLVQH